MLLIRVGIQIIHQYFNLQSYKRIIFTVYFAFNSLQQDENIYYNTDFVICTNLFCTTMGRINAGRTYKLLYC